MKLFIFPQYQRMMDHFRAIANGCAIDKMRDPICRVEAKDGAVQLLDHTMNVLALTGGETQIVAPDIIPGKARQFCLRLTAMGENTLTFTGAAFESDAAGSLTAPADGETVIYTFTETLGGGVAGGFELLISFVSAKPSKLINTIIPHSSFLISHFSFLIPNSKFLIRLFLTHLPRRENRRQRER